MHRYRITIVLSIPETYLRYKQSMFEIMDKYHKIKIYLNSFYVLKFSN